MGIQQRICTNLLAFYTVGEVPGHTLAGIGASLGMSINFEAVTTRYGDIHLERKKEVLDTYYAAIHPHPKQPNKQKIRHQKVSCEKQKKSIEIGW